MKQPGNMAKALESPISYLEGRCGYVPQRLGPSEYPRVDCASVCVFASVLPVELVDVLDVAEQRADLLWFQRQSAAVDDAAQIVLQDTSRTC